MRILFATLCLQSSYTPLYNYLENRLKQYGKIVNSQTVKISENEVNSANDLFKGLAVIDTLGGKWKFAKLWQSVMPEANEAFFDRVTSFMDVFFDAIQLKSDTSENADEVLNANEILVLKNMMSFSVIVSIDILAEK
ncbi:KAP P-loop protein [Candidatus Thiomargarita nelsonii]|uniref:KAP P-loop protein n=1 Tax=Candidatus Thiomargarita nelsonii TaxID=1003181 RepID=A0A176RV50_9GAMM|nr:KAP P-loop protein [Candidatus Thiomargarita nelsonii]